MTASDTRKTRPTGDDRLDVTRRGCLRGLLAGGALATLPLPRLARAMGPNGDRFADGRPLPRRFGVWFFGNGIHPEAWHPAGPGGTGSDWSLSRSLSPLAAHKAYLSVLSGYEVRADGAHVGGTAGALTGAVPHASGGAQRPSIDQLVAAGPVGEGTPLRSVEVGLSKATPAGPQPLLHAISHQGPSAVNYPEYDPHRLYGRLFGLSAAPDAERLSRRSVLDVVRGDFTALRARVGQGDRRRLDAHADAVRDLERRLAEIPMGACGGIAPPAADVRADDREEAPAALHDVMSRMIAMALACDLTNVFSYAFTLPAAHVYYRHLGEAFERSFHEDIVHLVDAIPDGYGLVAQGVEYTMQALATTLDHFAATAVGGGTLLDELAMLVTSDVSYGWTHEMRDYPALVVGRACGALRGDVHVPADGAQRNFSDILLTLARVGGVRADALGLGACRSTTTVDAIVA